MGQEKSHWECQKLTIFLKSLFSLTQPESSVGHFQTGDSPTYILMYLSILRTVVSELALESRPLESRGQRSRQNRPFSSILAIFWSTYLKEEIILLSHLHCYVFGVCSLAYFQRLRAKSVEMVEL